MPTPTTDFSIFDAQETVTYLFVNGDPALENVPAVRRPLTQSGMRNVERYVELQATDVVFHLDATSFSSSTVLVGDLITDVHAVTYNVLFVERQTLTNTLAVVCRPPAP
jgi:uncharacterized protein YgbK (DUF1537 family)